VTPWLCRKENAAAGFPGREARVFPGRSFTYRAGLGGMSGTLPLKTRGRTRENTGIWLNWCSSGELPVNTDHLHCVQVVAIYHSEITAELRLQSLNMKKFWSFATFLIALAGITIGLAGFGITIG
jgi:hypothetical protein